MSNFMFFVCVKTTGWRKVKMPYKPPSQNSRTEFSTKAFRSVILVNSFNLRLRSTENPCYALISAQTLKRLRPRPHVSGYFWIRNFFFPDSPFVHTYPDILESATFFSGFAFRLHVSGYSWIRNFFFPDSPFVHTYPANSHANPQLFESALRSGNFWIR